MTARYEYRAYALETVKQLCCAICLAVVLLASVMIATALGAAIGAMMLWTVVSDAISRIPRCACGYWRRLSARRKC